MQPQIGKEYFGKIIVWRNLSSAEFLAHSRSTLARPGMELSEDEIVAVFQDGLIQRDARTGTYYRIVMK